MAKRVFWRPGLRFLVRYQDEAIVVVEKKAGLLSQATNKGDEVNLYGALLAFLRKRNPKAKLFAVHRLDRVVSGLLVFAKTREAQQHLIAQFKAHTATRIYHAAIHGQLDPPEGRLVSHLYTKDLSFLVREVSPHDPEGQKAVTDYSTVEYLPKSDTSLVELQLQTGIRNQIRVQLAARGHPLLGEKKYAGGRRASRAQGRSRIFLHAAELAFVHPDGQARQFEAELPPDLARWLEALERGPQPSPPKRDRRHG